MNRMFRRGIVFWCQHNETRKQESLHTKDRQEAERLLDAKNAPTEQASLNRQIGRAYLAASDPAMMTRTWEEALQRILALEEKNKAPTLRRWRVAVKDKALDGNVRGFRH